MLRKEKRRDLCLKRTADDKPHPSTAIERQEALIRFCWSKERAGRQEQPLQAPSEPIQPETETRLGYSSQKPARIVLLKKASWFDRNLHRAVTSFAKNFVGFADLIKRKLMSDERREVDPLGSDHFHQSPHPFLTARAKRGRDLVIADPGGKRVIRHLELAGIHTEARKSPSGTEAAETILKSPLHS